MTRSSRNSFYFRPDKPIQSAERYVLADIEMQDLGLVQPPRLSREERKKNRSPFLEFDTASSECLRILDHRMRHPASNESLINQRRSPILALYELLERNPRGAQFAAKALINELNTFTQATNNFNRELRSAREKVYPLSEATVRSCGYQHLIGVFYEREDGKFYRDHWAPYPIQARPLLELIKAVKILESISKLLGSSNEASLKSLAQKIDLKLANPALKPILRSELISSNTREILNPYLAVRAQEIELKSKEWESEGFSKSYQEAYSLYWSKVSEDSCQTFMRRQEWEWRKAAEDRSELSEKLGAELRSLFETYRELHLLKVNEDVSTKRPGHRTPNNPFLTGLCSTIQGSLIPKLEYYARVALMLANGARFPEIGEPSTQQGARQDIFQIKGFKNTSIREEAPNKGGMDVLFPWFNQVSKPKITAKPVDISIPDSSHTILLTGPSNSGKTVIVQSVGAIKVCTQVGLPIFAESASLKIKGRVFTAFSASYQYQDGLGHLALTLHRLRAIYEQARAGDTVLIDELPAGTNYQELKEITFKIYRSFIERGVTLAASSHNKQPIRRLRDELAANVQKTQMSSDRGTIKFNYNPTPGVAEHS
jgi:hypothetical protein